MSDCLLSSGRPSRVRHASRWWLNGAPVIALNDDRQTVIDDGVSNRVTLHAGANVIRAAIINGGGATDFCARFLDAQGNPIKTITVTLDDPSGATTQSASSSSAGNHP